MVHFQTPSTVQSLLHHSMGKYGKREGEGERAATTNKAGQRTYVHSYYLGAIVIMQTITANTECFCTPKIAVLRRYTVCGRVYFPFCSFPFFSYAEKGREKKECVQHSSCQETFDSE